MATSIHFKQYDSRWASKRYPTWGTGTMKYCGCGATTAAIVISSIDKTITPYICAKELSNMKNGVTKGGATYLWALKKLLENHGFVVEKHTSVSTLIKALKRSDRETYGIVDIWGTKSGVTWVSGGKSNGHYIPLTSIKGEDTVWVKDPGLRKHTGWFDYSKYMSGHVKMSDGFYAMTVYHPSTVKKPVAPSKPSTPQVPQETSKPSPVVPEKTANQKAIEAAVEYAKYLAANNNIGYKYYDKTDHMCPICHPGTKVKGFNCIGLVAACYAHGAGDAKMLANCKKNNGSALGNNVTLTSVTLDSWRAKNGNSWTMISSGTAKNSKSLSVDKLKAGDILIGYDSKGKYKHTMIYIGGGKLVDAKSSGTKAEQIGIRNYTTRASNMRISRAFRYTGEGRF